jgi:hypothetical protein
MRSRIGFIHIKEWFPPDDAVATNMARLCILREDLFLESQAVRADELTQLDANGEDWRRLYFHRNIFRTLDSIKSAMHQLRSAMKKEGLLESFLVTLENPEIKKTFDELVSDMDKLFEEFLKDFRDAVGGHLKEERLRQVLLDCDEKGLIHLAEKIGNHHYKFATNLVIGMMVTDVPKEKKQLTLEARGKRVGQLSWAIKTIDEIFWSYIGSRQLLKNAPPAF